MAQSRKRRGGKAGGAILGFFLAATVLFAFIKGTGVQSFQDVIEVFQGEAPGVEEFVKNLVGDQPLTWTSGDGDPRGDVNAGGGGAADPETGFTFPELPSGNADKALESLTVAPAEEVNYDRDEWRHWDNITSCWTVREEVLYRQAQKDSLTLLDKNKQNTSNKSNACEVAGGTWVDPYTGEKFTNPADLDIDHMIPLGYAAAHGGQKWDEDRKRDYANSLDSGHLLAVSASANRSKSDQGPGNWKPRNKDFYCDYAKSWVSVASQWDLSVAESDKKALSGMLETC